jgi:A/G-specific adenine glycosylase
VSLVTICSPMAKYASMADGKPKRIAAPRSESAWLQGNNSTVSEVRAALLAWYALHKRDLPWRQDCDAYRVWVSEIMLQQTRVAAVLEHYRVFLDAFPTIEALASAPEERVLALWSGLGYYRRARMLHRASQLVVSELGGVIPRQVESLRKLPGVGRYTASAIASIAFGVLSAVVDGNVERVLCRLDGDGSATPRDAGSVWKRAQELLDPCHPGDWNQAMMELGATICTPQNPQCLVCPVRPWCRAPGAQTGRPRAARKRVQIVRALIEHNHRLYLVQRSADARKMASMWEFPEIADQLENRKELCRVRHSITDTDYEVRVVSLSLKALAASEKKAGRWVDEDEIWDLPLTGLTRKILRKQGPRWAGVSTA